MSVLTCVWLSWPCRQKMNSHDNTITCEVTLIAEKHVLTQSDIATNKQLPQTVEGHGRRGMALTNRIKRPTGNLVSCIEDETVGGRSCVFAHLAQTPATCAGG